MVAAGFGAGPSAGAAQEPPAPAAAITVETLKVRGLKRLDPPVTLPRLPLRPGQPYTAERIEATEQVIALELAERGRPYAAIEVSAEIDHARGTARVLLEVDPGPPVVFGPVTIRAEPPVSEVVVRDRLGFEPGETFRPSRLRITEEMLLELPVIAAVAVDPVGLELGDTAVAVVVLVTTVPRPRGLELSGTVSSIRCLELASFWRDRYFLDGPRLFSVGFGFGNLFARQLGGRFPCTDAGETDFAGLNYFVATDLHIPWRGSPRTTLRTQAFVRRESAPQVYVLEGFGGELGARRQIRRGLYASAAYSPERNRLRAAGFFFCVNFGACTADEVATFSRARWLAPLQLQLQWLPPDLRDPLRAGVGAREEGPWPGVLGPAWRPWLRAGVAAAAGATGSDLTYARALVEGALTRVLGPRFEVAGRARVGGLARGDDVLPPQVRFYSGGANTVRGIAQNLLGPRALVSTPAEILELGCEPVPGGCPADLVVDPGLVSQRPRGGHLVFEANLEARFRAARRLQLAGFVDYGALRGEGRRFGDDPAGRAWDAVATPGVGARVDTRLGRVRVDVGYDPRGSRLLPLLAEDPEDGSVIFLGDVVYDPYTWDQPGRMRELFRRLHVSLGLGQPF